MLDFLWHTERHELCHPASLVCSNPDVARQMTQNLEDQAGIAFDIEEAEKTASDDVQAQREEALAKILAEQKRKKSKLVDPLEFEMSIKAEDLSNYVPAFGWECAPPSDKQVKALEKFDINPDAVESAGKAFELLKRLEKRRAEGLSSPKQIRQLEHRGFQNVDMWTREQAKRLIDRIAANNWKTPRNIDPRTYVPPAIEHGELSWCME